jgi:hypothetical protein
MALVCNDPVAAGEALEGLAGYGDPAAHARLVALRARPPARAAGALRDDPRWQRATAQLEAALARPTLDLDG